MDALYTQKLEYQLHNWLFCHAVLDISILYIVSIASHGIEKRPFAHFALTHLRSRALA